MQLVSGHLYLSQRGLSVQVVPSLEHFKENSKGKVKGPVLAYVNHTRDQKRFTISEVAADCNVM